MSSVFVLGLFVCLNRLFDFDSFFGGFVRIGLAGESRFVLQLMLFSGFKCF